MTGADLVAAIVAEMAEEGVQPTAKEDALLRTASQLVDRLTRARGGHRAGRRGHRVARRA